MISVFDMFSVGIGPSSSHTVGPMKAALKFVTTLQENDQLANVDEFKAELFGSLGQTGKGHGTGKAIILGLSGYAPETVDIEGIEPLLQRVQDSEIITPFNSHSVSFSRKDAIIFHRRKTLPKHSNALTFYAYANAKLVLEQTYYSLGGGFIINDADYTDSTTTSKEIPKILPKYPFSSAVELLEHCHNSGLSISSIMLANEQSLREQSVVIQGLYQVWEVMRNCIQRGIKSEGILPGGLKVTRRAPALAKQLAVEQSHDPLSVMDWVNLFALAVNEENAAGGRVVTAPTNGAAGIIPAVLSYYDKFVQPLNPETTARFLLTAAAIGILYQKNASISGAEVGCQGEVGVACSMAAGALTELLGGSPNAVENAAEIGMEHNLGLTCDPVGGLVQVPCIERNAMGAVKAINASRLALRGNGQHKVSLDKVIKTMRDTGRDMRSKYKETARGGLAVNIIEC
ncbi:L-serine ammonia-lyase [Opacimonas viscosa]|uniref:L-serine dehydratase n=1 Tax=Opacimonas viscosa TaxID=2961944 RepID=A0AA41WVK0_9ALTE|nr:L-serine ammonia-lyase [Opacimonas viscosa]MCP3427384.1 L-serine ammonia-lyase [Opacimonas viscosa]